MTTEKIKTILTDLSQGSGVYQMYDSDKNLLYVGKARNLKRRVSSYFQNRLLNSRIISMVTKVDDIQIIHTSSESEALLLEDRLIKHNKPIYNVMLRDDKSYPFIRLSGDPVPALKLYRSPRDKKTADMFGPFTSVKNVRSALKQLQSAFQLRNCSDSTFKLRKRPCLEYQIGRCSAPCVNYISRDDYLDECNRAQKFLNGKEQDLIEELTTKMHDCSQQFDYENAAKYRDKITSVTKLLSKQVIFSRDSSDCDVIVGMQKSANYIAIVKVRRGNIVETSYHSPKTLLRENIGSVITSFISLYYLSSPLLIPEKLLVWPQATSRSLLADALSSVKGKKVQIKLRLSEDEKNWMKFAQSNLEQNSEIASIQEKKFAKRLEAFNRTINQTISSVDCMDISHHLGDHAFGACVYFDKSGANKKQWRLYTIDSKIAGDDYASIYDVVQRRYNSNERELVPIDLLLIDGGKGQVNAALSALHTTKYQPKIVMGISKGPARISGAEKLFLFDGKQQLELFPNELSRLFLQAVRDEAHRFAITNHRKKSRKHVSRTTLLDIPNIGLAMQKKLISNFGGLQPLKNASMDDIQRIHGIGEKTAKLIHKHLQIKFQD